MIGRQKKILLCLCGLCLLAVCIIGLVKKKPEAESWGSFTADRTYSYDNKYYAVQEVDRSPASDGYIKITVYETETDEMADFFHPARARDFWGICWERDSYNIWIQSADVGIYCYKFKDMRWQKDESAQRPDYIKSKYDEQEP